MAVDGIPGSELRSTIRVKLPYTLSPSIQGVEVSRISRQVSTKSELTIRFSTVFADQSVRDGYNAHANHIGFVSARCDSDVEAFKEHDLTAR